MKKLLLTLAMIVATSYMAMSQISDKKKNYIVIGNDTIPKSEIVDYKSDTTRNKYSLEDKLIFEQVVNQSVKTKDYNKAKTTIKTTQYQTNPKNTYAKQPIRK